MPVPSAVWCVWPASGVAAAMVPANNNWWSPTFVTQPTIECSGRTGESAGSPCCRLERREQEPAGGSNLPVLTTQSTKTAPTSRSSASSLPRTGRGGRFRRNLEQPAGVWQAVGKAAGAQGRGCAGAQIPNPREEGQRRVEVVLYRKRVGAGEQTFPAVCSVLRKTARKSGWRAVQGRTYEDRVMSRERAQGALRRKGRRTALPSDPEHCERSRQADGSDQPCGGLRQLPSWDS